MVGSGVRDLGGHISLAASPSIRGVRSPLTAEMLSPLDARCRIVQFNSMLSDADFERLSTLLSDYPDVALRAYGSYDGTITDVEFLRYFPTLQRFMADALYHSLHSLDGLRHLPEGASEIAIGQTKKRLSLDILGRFTSLHRLWLEGQTKGIDVISKLRSLRDLSLRSITLPDLSILTPLDALRLLDIKLGGTKNLALLPEIGKLEYLELWLVRGLSDISPVANLPHLRYLFLQALKNVTALPPLDRMTALRGIHLETMKGLRDLTPLRSAPALEELFLCDMPHLQVADLQCLVNHPTLRAARLGLGSIKKNDAATALLGLPDFRPLAAWRSSI
jgi:hypothetical protein